MASALTPKQVAERWQCSERKVYLMIKSGALPAFCLEGKLFRLRLADVEEFECGGSPGLKANCVILDWKTVCVAAGRFDKPVRRT